MKIFNLIFIFLLVVIVIYSGYYLSRSNENLIVTIPYGSTTKEIAKVLLENKLISNESIFVNISKITGFSKKLQSGTYKINRRAGTLKILLMLWKGKTFSLKVTVPEGYTAEQIAELLQEKKLCDNEKFMKLVDKNRLEGYLFPDTYFFSPGISEQEIIDRMTAEFGRQYLSEFNNKAKELRLTKNDVVSLASIVEKEAKIEEERKLIARVFLNRLKKGWHLESCATIRYALKNSGKPLTYKDLKVKSPYNTYRNYGLPPGPICNPGLLSIKAVLYPADSDNMFFFTKNGGTHQFSKYYDEHIKKQR